MRENATYEAIKALIQPGDLVAFGGTSLFSRWAKLTTWSNVTHVAAVSACHHCPDSGNVLNHDVFEATVRNRKRGVMVNKLATRIEEYEGDIWWLPLHKRASNQFHKAEDAVRAFIRAENGKAYDIWQLFGSTVDYFDNHRWLWWLTRNVKCQQEWFCSELIAELYNQAGVTTDVLAAETTPIDLCRFSIFQNRYVQLKGNNKSIRKFNSRLPDKWGQWLTDEDEPGTHASE